MLARGGDLGQCCQVVQGLHRRLSDFIHAVVVHRREEAIRGWRGWLREDLFDHPYKWLRPELVPPAPFLQCDPVLTPGGSGVLADPLRIDEEFQKAWFPNFFCRGKTNLEEFAHEVGGWLPVLTEVVLPRLSGSLLAEWFIGRRLLREFKVLPVSWFDDLARISSCVEDSGVWPDGLLDAYIAMIPKTDGNATPLGQRPLSVLPVVYRIWASARMGQLEDWFKSCFLDSVFSAGGGRGSVEAWYTTALDIEEVLSGVVVSDVHLFVADVVKSCDTVDRGVLDLALSSLGLPGWFRHAYFEFHSHVRLRFELAAASPGPGMMEVVLKVSFEHDVYCCFVFALV